MNQDATLRAHLLDKFDQLPITGQPAADWKKLEKTLQIAMPVGLLTALALNWKLWLSKKFVWGWIILLGGGGATAVMIYDSSRQADLAPSVNAAKPITVSTPSPKSDRKTSPPKAAAALIYTDTTLKQIAKDTTRILARKRKTLARIERDTVMTMRNSKSPPRIERDTVRAMRSRKSPPRIERDTVRAMRNRKSSPRIERDTVRTMRKRKPSPSIEQDTVRSASRPRKSLARIVRDSVRATSRPRKSPPRIERDSTRRMSRPRKSPPRIERDSVGH